MAERQGVQDKFQIKVQQFLKDVGHIVPKITEARRTMYQASIPQHVTGLLVVSKGFTSCF